MNNKVEIGARLKEFAEKNFSTLTDFAAQMGKDKTFFTTYFKGKSILGGELLAKLSDLGCDINWLLTGEEKEKHIMKEEKIEYISNEVEHLKLELKILKDLYVKEQIDFKKRIKERDKKLEKLQAENEKLKTDNNKLRVGGALINSKGVTGSVKRGGP